MLLTEPAEAGNGLGQGQVKKTSKLFKSPKVDYFIQQSQYDRNKSVLETERARAMNERKFQYYNSQVKERNMAMATAARKRRVSPGACQPAQNSNRAQGGGEMINFLTPG